MRSPLLIGAALALTLYFIVLYNGLVGLKHSVAKAWANIDVLLKQRHDEIPKLVEVCKQYAQFEQQTLLKVMEARNAVASSSAAHDAARLGASEGLLRRGIAQLNAVAEAYPELKANEQFSQLSRRISALEDSIADRRELYNEAVNLNNMRIEQFPDLLIARLFGFAGAHPLRFESHETCDVDVSSLFRQP
ncbi:LemA family protein [Chromobacterium alticapitis]|uniref:LemA family protein n=1 Tax=Chromobacterium alticapitis TaxID=2073169 RepID=A0A2S5DAG5_9NEIS|nr:LemA family protein [Chromobacterium alticapitis]POZ60034.1 LemA family protein [Chromobacterium alticapitis]